MAKIGDVLKSHLERIHRMDHQVEQIKRGYSECIPETLGLIATSLEDDTPLSSEARDYIVESLRAVTAAKTIKNPFWRTKRAKKLFTLENQTDIAKLVEAMRNREPHVFEIMGSRGGGTKDEWQKLCDETPKHKKITFQAIYAFLERAGAGSFNKIEKIHQDYRKGRKA